MALHADLKVNGTPIGWVRIQRLSPLGQPDDDDVCRYEWQIYAHGAEAFSIEPVEHRYGDGPWALVARVVEAAGWAPPLPGSH